MPLRRVQRPAFVCHPPIALLPRDPPSRNRTAPFGLIEGKLKAPPVP
jgi:hypothetical protein